MKEEQIMLEVTSFDDPDGMLSRRSIAGGFVGSTMDLALAGGESVTGELVAVARPHDDTHRDVGYAILLTGTMLDPEHVAVGLSNVEGVAVRKPVMPSPSDSAAGHRIALLLTAWSGKFYGKKVSELPERDFGEGLGLAQALGVALSASFASGGTADFYAGDHAYVSEAVEFAQQVLDRLDSWRDAD